MTDSQCTAILKHLKRGRGLTALEAIKRFQTLRLAARINELREDGYPISTEIVKDRKTGKRFARYRMQK
jgi:hypothetical protein